jgi:CheY-like chemotaxis protein
MMTQYRVLVADVPAGARLISTALRGAAEVMPVSTGDEAIDRAREADLLALSVHFNNSRIFDVIRMTKSNPKTRYTPLLCFRSQDREIPVRVLEALALAQSLFGHIEFLDVAAARKAQGDEEALRILRAALLMPLQARMAVE